MQGGAPWSSAGIPSGKSQLVPWMFPDVPAGQGLATGAIALILVEPVEPAALGPSHAELQLGVGRRTQVWVGWPGRSTAQPRVHRKFWLHSSGWERVQHGWLTGPQHMGQPSQEAGTASVGRALDLPPRPGTPRVGFSDSWVLQELYPPKAGSSECPILLQELHPPSRVGSFKNWIL